MMNDFEQQITNDLQILANNASVENLPEKILHRLHRRTFHRRIIATTSVAATLIIGFFLVNFSSESAPLLTAAEIDKALERANISTKLLLSAQTLAQAPGGEKLAYERFRYVISKYPGTEAAIEANSQLQSLFNQRNIQ